MNISSHIALRLNDPKLITWHEYEDMISHHGMNSYERHLLVHKMDNDCFRTLVMKCLGQIGGDEKPFTNPCSTYNEAITHHLIYEALRRIK
jgi:hypothetical protein